MWQRSTKERRGNGSYLVLNGPVFGGRRVCGVASLALPRDRTRWCRGGVDLRCRRAVSQCSGEGNRRERGSGLGGTGRTLWRGSGSGRCKPPVQDWHSVSESVVTREGGAWRPSPKHVILGEKHHRSRGASQGSELARDHYGTPSVEQEGKLDLGETETWRPYFRAWSNPSRPSDILTRPGETDDARLDLGIFPRQHHRTSCCKMILP